MFAKFNLRLQEGQIEENYREYALQARDVISRSTHRILSDYLLNDGSLDASAMERDWFPEIKANVFLSHSHADEEAVIRFAGFLYKEYGLTCFIDSTVWGYADDLLKQIDDKYCVQTKDELGKKTYSYEKRNRSTSQVHLLLQGALAKMIDKCECLIFVNTPHSIQVTEMQNVTNTASPWIYSELLMANTFPRRDYDEYRSDELEHSSYRLSYHVNLTGFVDLTLEDIIDLKKNLVINTPTKVLELLYLRKQVLIQGER